MTAGDWAEVRDMLGKDAGPGVRKKARSNPKQPHKRVRKALKKVDANNDKMPYGWLGVFNGSHA